MKALQKLLLAYLGKTLGKSDDEVAALIYKADEKDATVLTDELQPDALKNILELDVARVESLSKKGGDGKGKFDDGYSKGKKETLTKLEKALRERFEFESDEVGEDFIVALVSDQVTKAGDKTLTPEKIKLTDTYRELEKRAKKEKEELATTHQQELDKIQGEHQTQQTRQTVKEAALKELTGLNPVFSKTATIAETQKRDFLNALTGNGTAFKIEKDNTIVLMDGDKRKEDEHGNPIDFKKYVKQVASERFEFEKQSKKGNSGNSNDKEEGGGKGTPFTVPKSREEMNDKIFAASTAEERATMVTAWNEANPDDKIGVSQATETETA